MGGGSIYRQFMPLADTLYLTLVHKDYEADIFFPEIDFNEWDCIEKEEIPFDEALGFSYTYLTCHRKKS